MVMEADYVSAQWAAVLGLCSATDVRMADVGYGLADGIFFGHDPRLGLERDCDAWEAAYIAPQEDYELLEQSYGGDHKIARADVRSCLDYREEAVCNAGLRACR